MRWQDPRRVKIPFPFSPVCPDVAPPCEMPELRSLIAMRAPTSLGGIDWQLYFPTPLVLTRWGL